MSDMRGTIMETAARLGCVDEVSPLSDIQAVRYIQRREGFSPCYAGERPLKPDGGFSPTFCSIPGCAWSFSCNQHRLPNPLMHGGGRASREEIITQADRYDCAHEIAHLPDVEAVRLIQQRAGFTACYAREQPLSPRESNPRSCDTYGCRWAQPCDAYRSEEIIPLDKELNEKNHETIQLFRLQIDDFKARLQPGSLATVGMKILSFEKAFPATRKMLVAAPQTILGESTEDTSRLKRYLFADKSGVVSGSTGGYVFDYALDILFASDINLLNRWLLETRPFIESGNLAYYPLIKRFVRTTNVSRGGAYSSGNTPSIFSRDDAVALESFHASHLGVPDGDIMLTNADFAPILNIDLPVLENVDFKTLHQLMADFPEELTSFRDFFHARVDEMQHAAVGSEQFGRDCRRLEGQIRDHIRKLDSDFKKTRLKTAITMTGCAVASWTLALYCILHGTGDILTILGPGGVVYTATSAYSEYLTNQLDLKDDPVFFLWSLGKTKRKG